jgi:hypothetical protein
VGNRASNEWRRIGHPRESYDASFGKSTRAVMRVFRFSLNSLLRFNIMPHSSCRGLRHSR